MGQISAKILGQFSAQINTYGSDWTVSLTSGSIDAQDANSLTLSDDADGTITLADGSPVDFFEIERIEFLGFRGCDLLGVGVWAMATGDGS